MKKLFRSLRNYAISLFTCPLLRQRGGAAALPIAILGSAGISAGSSSKAAESQSDAINNAASKIYQPKYSGQIDELLKNLLTEQAGYKTDFGQFEPVIANIMGSYMDAMGKPYTYQGAGGTEQVLNPEWTAWNEAQQNAPASGLSPELLNKVGGAMTPYGGWNAGKGGFQSPYNRFGASGKLTQPTTPEPSKYISQGTPGKEYPYEVAPVSIDAFLKQYLTEAFEPTEGGVYDVYANRLTQGVRSGLSARGLNTSPYGAGIEGESLEEFSRKWALMDEERQRVAMESYLSGKGNIQDIGRGALQTALTLEQAKGGGLQPNLIPNLLGYMGQGVGAGAGQANILSNLNPGAGWQSAASGTGELTNQLMTKWLNNMGTTPAGTIPSASNQLVDWQGLGILG